MPPQKSRRPTGLRALFIAGLYLLVGAAWIFFSDHIATAIAGEVALLATAQLIKGLGYVLLTAVGLFFLVRHQLRALERSERAVQAQLRERQRVGLYLETIIDASPSAIFDLDQEGRVAEVWNPAAETLLGYTRTEAIGSRPVEVPERAMRASDGADTGGSQSDDRKAHIETELRRKDGNTVPVLLATAAIVEDGAAEQSTARRTLVIVTDISDLRQTRDRLEVAVAERDVLLREVHHRVKNNLQLISSLLSIEGGKARCPDADRVVARTRSRIQAFAHIHEQLYKRRDLSHIRVDQYIEAVARETIAFYGGSERVRLQTNLDSCERTLDVALPLGLIVHESLLTWFEATTGTGARGAISVALRDGGDSIELVMEGGESAERVSTPAATVPPATSGHMLIEALTKQVGGEILTLTDGCSRVQIRVPSPDGDAK